jgi:hypothetical protein
MTSAADLYLTPTASRRRRRRRFQARITAIVIALVAAVFVLVVFAAAAASAVPVTGRAFGYFSPEGGGFWLGSWRLADGTLAFCVNTERSTPNGEDFEYADGAELGWYSTDDAARLAYISRTWAATTDPTTAAAGQIATWTLTGLGSHTQEELAAKAGDDAPAVLDLARRMLAETDRFASRSVSAGLQFDQAEPDGTVSVLPTLSIDTLASGLVSVPAGTHEGTVTLTGATFEGGARSATVRNGTAVPILVPGASAIVEVSATVRFEGLNYGSALTMAVAKGGAQNLLTARQAGVAATATRVTGLPSDRPFQPVVSTRTSAAVAADGTTVFDTVIIGVTPTPSFLAEWPVYGPPGGPWLPVPVTVRSRLLGPFAEEITPAAAPPPGSPVLCEVSLVITTGPGTYTTPECTLAGPGTYVWVETISPADTTPAHGRSRVLPWTSPFGVAAEITAVNPPPVPPAVERPKARVPITTLPETGADPVSHLHLTALALALGAAGVLLPRRRWASGAGTAVSPRGRVAVFRRRPSRLAPGRCRPR